MDRVLHILHLEDDARDAELVEATLIGGGIQCAVRRVQTRETYERALRSGGFDVILSDFSLPGFDGATALAMAREIQPEVPLILVSGIIGEEAAIDSLLAGATDYVLKNRLSRLVPAIRRALAEAEDRRARRRAEEARRASEAKYRQLFESSKDGLLIIERDTEQILDVNPAFLELVGYTRDEVVGSTVTDVGLAGQDPACEAAFREVVSRDEGHFPDLQLTGREGRRLDVDMISNAYFVGDQRVVQCSVRDISERRRLENQLRVSQKLEAVGQLAGGIAHDFNNLLVVINSYTDMAIETLREGDPMRADLQQVAEAGARAAGLTRQLLAFGRRQFLQPKVLSLNTVVSGIEQMLRRLIGEDIELRIKLSPDAGNVRADPAQVEQVLMNLVLNARDAMPQGGRLVVETADVELDELYAKTHADVKPGSFVLLAVSDTGSGMDQKILGRIFEPFFTTKGPGKGTGRGLATVYGIVKQSGGYINVKSEVGRGSTFQVYLPRDASKPTVLEAERRPAPAGGSETILVVEDDDGIRRLIHRMLEPAGYKVVSAGTGQELLRICQQWPGPVDLLLTDVVMPTMSGSAVAARVSELRPSAKILFMSGYMDEAIGHHGVPETGINFIHKPFSAEGLLRRVREALDERNPLADVGAG